MIYRLIALLEAAYLALSLISPCNSQEQLDLSILLDQPAATASADGDTLDLSLLGFGDAAAQEPAECLDLSVFGIEAEPTSARVEALDLSVLDVGDAAPLIKPDFSRLLQPKPTDSAEIKLQKFVPGQSQLQASYPKNGKVMSVADNWHPTREQVIAHLLSGDQHAGKFTAAYLNGLDIEELKSLHYDDHHGIVQASYLQQVATKPVAPAVTPATTTVQYASPCPGGKCPTYSYGYATTKAPKKKGIFARLARK